MWAGSAQHNCGPSTMPPMAQTFDVCIRGAGIVGRSLALLLARERLRVALVADTGGPDAGRKPKGRDDVRLIHQMKELDEENGEVAC